jgi:hypothetical protein
MWPSAASRSAGPGLLAPDARARPPNAGPGRGLYSDADQPRGRRRISRRAPTGPRPPDSRPARTGIPLPAGGGARPARLFPRPRPLLGDGNDQLLAPGAWRGQWRTAGGCFALPAADGKVERSCG